MLLLTIQNQLELVHSHLQRKTASRLDHSDWSKYCSKPHNVDFSPLLVAISAIMATKELLLCKEGVLFDLLHARLPPKKVSWLIRPLQLKQLIFQLTECGFINQIASLKSVIRASQDLIWATQDQIYFSFLVYVSGSHSSQRENSFKIGPFWGEQLMFKVT